MPNTYTLLETITVGAANASSVTFNSIPQTGYTDLVLYSSVRCTAAEDSFNLRFNNDSGGANYTWKRLLGDGSSVSSLGATQNQIPNQFMAESGYTGNTFSNNTVYIPNFTSSNSKSVSIDSVNERNASNPRMNIAAGLYSPTTAISRIDLIPGAGSFAQHSTFSLYGVSALGTTPTKAPKATGGSIIQTDGTYWYHAFLSSGTFTPATALTCDVLVVAGGGGGQTEGFGGNRGGGGGAGGVLAFTAQAIGTSAQTVTIGAGGSAGLYPSTSATNGGNSSFAALTASVGGGRGNSSAGSGVGGSGGGGNAGYAGSAGTAGQGNAGGSGQTTAAGGGGGAGGVGANGISGGPYGTGGIGLNTWSSWLSPTGLGVSGYIAGGGGGTAAAGGAGGGGGTEVAGTPNTGGGGGGSASSGSGAAGGSGLVIVRYLA
jgi:hypothetical protein